MGTESVTKSTSTLQHLLAYALSSMKLCSDNMNSIIPTMIKSGSSHQGGHLPTETKVILYKLREELRLALQDVSDYLSYVDTPIDRASSTIMLGTMDGLVQDSLELKSDI